MRPTQEINKSFRDKRTQSDVLAKTKATDAQWQMMDWAIKAFIAKYPHHWMGFQDELKIQRSILNPYQQATRDNKELRKASWRNVASFPVIEDKDGNAVDSLLPVLKKIIPELTNRNSVNFATFVKKYPFFLPGEKY